MNKKTQKKKQERGTCRFCGCTDSQACNPPCWWIDAKQTVCSSPSCVRKAKKAGMNIIAPKHHA